MKGFRSLLVVPLSCSPDANGLSAPRETHHEQYRAGKKTVAGFFVGQIMRASKGQANPALLNELVAKKLEG